MAVGTVSAATPNQWQLLQTTTLSNPTSVATLSGISGYKTIMVAMLNVTGNGSGYPTLVCNSDTTTGNYGGGANTSGSFIASNFTMTNYTAQVIINDVDKSVPHLVTVQGNNPTQVSQTAGTSYANPVPITSISVYPATDLGTTTFASGTIYFYGLVS